MFESKTSVGCITIEVSVEIAATPDKVWQTLFDEIQQWWLPDFRAVGADSVVTFDRAPGGKGMLETTADGGGLQWFSVQMCLPSQHTVYLVGHIAPQWGGPTTSNLKIAIQEKGDGICVMTITDARHGHIDEAQTQSYADGWTMLFTDGLKKYVESS